MKESKQVERLISYLEQRADERDVMAALRRGLGQPPGTVPAMYPYLVGNWIREDTPAWDETVTFLVATLFALHPTAAGTPVRGNLGHHFAQTNPQGQNDAVERRFTVLLNTHSEDIPDFLQRAISFLKSKDVPVNWHRLLSDLRWWRDPDGRIRVQKSWAAGYWGTIAENKRKQLASAEDPQGESV